MDKTKMMAIKAIKPRDYRTFTYKGEPIQVVQSFKYLGINVPLTNRSNLCNESRLQVVGIIIIYLRTNAIKVINEDGK